MKRLALHIIARTMFDVEIIDVEGRIGAAIETLSAIVTKQTGRVIQWPDWVPFPENRRKLAAVKVLDDIIRRVIRERRGSIEGGGADKGDLLSMLLRAVDEEGDGTGMTDEQARDEAITLFNAGQDTTAAGLTWLWYLLATHPEVEQKLRDEAQSVLGEREAGYADLPSLPYTAMVVKESLRLYPPTWALIPREAVDGCAAGRFCDSQGGLGLHLPVGAAAGSAVFPGARAVRARAVFAGAGGIDSAACLHPVWGRAARVHRQYVCADGNGAGGEHDRSPFPAGVAARFAAGDDRAVCRHPPARGLADARGGGEPAGTGRTGVGG